MKSNDIVSIPRARFERGSRGGKGIAHQRMPGADALMGAPKLYHPTPVRLTRKQLKLSAGLAKTKKNNEAQWQAAAAKREERCRIALALTPRALSSIKIIALREYEDNGYSYDVLASIQMTDAVANKSSHGGKVALA